MAIAAINKALTAVFSEDCNAFTAARSVVFGGGMFLAISVALFDILMPTTGDSSDAKDGMEPDSDLSPEFVLFGFSAEPCFKKACMTHTAFTTHDKYIHVRHTKPQKNEGGIIGRRHS
jgi:hypothetical protein